MSESPEERIATLNKVDFFEPFTMYEMRRFAGVPDGIVSYKPGVKIIEEGEADNCFYVLISGAVAIVKQNAELSALGAGELFGEMAFLANTVRSTSVVTTDDVTVFRINQELMQRLGCETREKIKDQCILKMVERIDQLNRRLRVRM